MVEEPEIIRTSLRLPKPLYEKLQAVSAGKTMHAEIIHRLEQSFEARPSEVISVDRATDLVTAIVARVAQDMMKDGRGPGEFVRWMAEFPEFYRVFNNVDLDPKKDD